MAVPLPDLLPMRPFFREVVWGGRRLEELFDKELPADKPIGESFELSALPGQESAVVGGPLEGSGLGGLVQTYGAELTGRPVWGRYGADFPLLIKLIDARDDLSIQVHPGDSYARSRDLGAFGKMEAWYVLESDGGRVAVDLEQGVGPAELQAAIEAGRAEEVVCFYEARRGDVVFLPPGTVHALCRGVVIYEVQQSSDLTFRLYDYGRPGLDGQQRELHVERALEVIEFGAARRPQHTGTQASTLVEAEHFCLVLHRTDGADPVVHQSGDSFLALTVIGGDAEVQGGRERCRLRPGDTLLVPAAREVQVKSMAAGQAHDPLEYLAAFVPV